MFPLPASKRPCIIEDTGPLRSWHAALEWVRPFAYSAHPSKAKRKERGIWLRAGSVMEQARTLRSGLLGAGSALPHAIEVPITVYGVWSWGWDLNPRPEDYKSTALSN